MNKSDKDFLEFIEGTLIPDLKEDGSEGVPADLERLVKIIRKLELEASELAATASALRSNLKKKADPPSRGWFANEKVPLQDLPIWDLQQFYANAKETCGCLGHGKAHANRAKAEEYYEEMKRRNVEPADRDGYFNGPGSS